MDSDSHGIPPMDLKYESDYANVATVWITKLYAPKKSCAAPNEVTVLK